MGSKSLLFKRLSMPNSVKIRDVAASAGVSIATVSYVMNGKAEGLGITLATRERVLEAIRQTGYRPNRAAREMAIGCLPPAGQAQLLSCQVAELPPAEKVVDCQVVELLGESPLGRPLTTQQLNNLTTALAALGCELVPVTSVNDLPQLPGGMVGVLYRQADATTLRQSSFDRAQDGSGQERVPPEKETSPLEGHASSWPGAQATATGTKTEIPEITPSTLAPEPVAVDMVAVPTWSRDALVTEVTAKLPETPHPDPSTSLRASPLPQGARGAELAPEPVSVISSTTQQLSNPTTVLPPDPVTRENPPGTDGARRSPSTVVIEPVAVDDIPPPTTTQQLSNPTTVLSATPEPEILPNSSCLSCPSMLNPSGDTEEKDSNIDRQDTQDRGAVPPTTTQQLSNPTTVLPSEPESAIVVPVIDTSPAPVVSVPVLEPEEPVSEVSQVAAEPVVVAPPPSTTQQPNNSTTVLSPEPVPVDIEVAAQLQETPHPDPLPQGARGAELAPEPVSVIFSTTQQPDNPTTVFSTVPAPASEPVVAAPCVETVPESTPVSESASTASESPELIPAEVVSDQEPPVMNQ